MSRVIVRAQESFWQEKMQQHTFNPFPAELQFQAPVVDVAATNPDPVKNILISIFSSH